MPKRPCNNCGLPYEEYAPDRLHDIHSTLECEVCVCNSISWYVTTYFECARCHQSNSLYWHVSSPHSFEQKQAAYKKVEGRML